MKPNPTHVFWHDKFTLKRIFDRTNFKIDELIYYCGNKEKYNFLLRPFILRQGIMVICSKNIV